jgi:hypothetical protein
MMSNNKKWYKLVFKQIQPIHVGAGSYGVINETRIFIPGWTMWGALTKAYNLKNGEALSKNHDVFENISCFYPCFNEDGNDVLFPKFEKGKFYLGNYSEDKFRAKFVDTFVSTAIDSRTNTAIDESLHELNIILPGVKADYLEDEKEIQLYWVGIVQLEESNKDSLPDEICIGGDARYGLGKMKLVKKDDIGESLPDDWKIKDGVLTNYFPVEAYCNTPQDSKIELLVEIVNSWQKADLQVKLREEDEEKGFFYVPGSKFNNTDSSSIKSIKKGVFTKEQTSERGGA